MGGPRFKPGIGPFLFFPSLNVSWMRLLKLLRVVVVEGICGRGYVEGVVWGLDSLIAVR